MRRLQQQRRCSRGRVNIKCNFDGGNNCSFEERDRHIKKLRARERCNNAQSGNGEKIPGIELVVESASKCHTNKVASEAEADATLRCECLDRNFHAAVRNETPGEKCHQQERPRQIGGQKYVFGEELEVDSPFVEKYAA